MLRRYGGFRDSPHRDSANYNGGKTMNTETRVGLVLPVDTIRDRLNRDAEFLLTARFWYCDIRFFIGEDPYFMRIENGKVDRFQYGTQGFDPAPSTSVVPRKPGRR
jgi:hypothetical protein